MAQDSGRGKEKSSQMRRNLKWTKTTPVLQRGTGGEQGAGSRTEPPAGEQRSGGNAAQSNDGHPRAGSLLLQSSHLLGVTGSFHIKAVLLDKVILADGSYQVLGN